MAVSDGSAGCGRAAFCAPAEAGHCPRTAVLGGTAGGPTLMWVMDRRWDEGAAGLGALRGPRHHCPGDRVPAKV